MLHPVCTFVGALVSLGNKRRSLLSRSGTVTDFFGPSRIPDSFIIVPEVEERHAIKPLVAQMLASLAVYRGIIRSATCRKRFCGWQIIVLGY